MIPLHRDEPPWNCPLLAAIRLARRASSRIVFLSPEFPTLLFRDLGVHPQAAEFMR